MNTGIAVPGPSVCHLTNISSPKPLTNPGRTLSIPILQDQDGGVGGDPEGPGGSSAEVAQRLPGFKALLLVPTLQGTQLLPPPPQPLHLLQGKAPRL